MTLRERWQRRLEQTRRAMATLSTGKKIEYIIYYYKGWFFGLLILCLFIGYAVDVYAQSRKEIVLQGFFTNDEWNLFESDTLVKEYSASLGLEKNRYVIFDDDLYVDVNGKATEYTAASNGKLIGYMATQALDFVVTTDYVLHHYEAETPMLDLREVIPPDLLEKLEPYLYYYTNREGEYKAIALEMTASRFIAGTWAENDSRIEDTYYLFVPLLAPNPGNTAEFIRWSFPNL